MKKIGRTPTLTAIDANEKTKIHGAHSVNLDMKTTFENMQDKLRHRLMLARKRLNVCLAQNEDLKKEINAYRLVRHKLCVQLQLCNPTKSLSCHPPLSRVLSAQKKILCGEHLLVSRNV